MGLKRLNTSFGKGLSAKYPHSLLIIYISKTESYEVKPNEPTHGYSGPLKVSYGGVYTNVGKTFLEMAAKYDKTRLHADDPNGLFSCNTYSVSPKISRIY